MTEAVFSALFHPVSLQIPYPAAYLNLSFPLTVSDRKRMHILPGFSALSIVRPSKRCNPHPLKHLRFPADP